MRFIELYEPYGGTTRWFNMDHLKSFTVEDTDLTVGKKHARFDIHDDSLNEGCTGEYGDMCDWWTPVLDTQEEVLAYILKDRNIEAQGATNGEVRKLRKR